MSKCALIIIDGLGVAPAGPGNARTTAATPTLDRLEQEVPNTLMQASGNAVGLPKGQQGASEPGHYTMGAGRVVWQPLEEINRAVRLGEFDKNAVLRGACERAKERDVPLHLLGIYSAGGVHGSVEHMHAMIKLADDVGVKQVVLHLIGDGRDVPKQNFGKDFQLLEMELKQHANTKVASLIGRYYAMDRDQQYKDRTKVAYDLYTQSVCEECSTVSDAAQHWYQVAPEKQQSDYYIKPVRTADFVPMKDDDVVVGMNFRSDRMIQIIRALEDPDFSEFDRPVRIKDVVCIGPYSDRLPIAFPAPIVKNTLGEVVSKAGKKQLRIAETDKMAHTTFFFNAQQHEPFEGEDRILIDSPKVPNYADTPEMSAAELADRLIQEVESEKYDLIVANFANCDLVGHGANFEAAVIACETVDTQLARLLPVLEEHGYEWIVTADHGNVEDMLLPDGTISPSHTSHPVQTFVHSKKYPDSASLEGLEGLKDIAPMCLKIMEMEVPEEMQDHD